MKKYVCTDRNYLSFTILTDIDDALEVNKYLNPYIYVTETNDSPQYMITGQEKNGLIVFSKDYSYGDNIIYIKDGSIYSLKRIILDLYARLLECKYSCDFYHASAIDKDGASVFVGDRGAGKTYNMIQGILSGGNFISNDKIALINDRVIGFPTTIGVRRKNLLLFDEYRKQFEKEGSLEKIKNEDNSTYDKISFNVHNFCKTFRCDIVPHTKLKEIIYLSDSNLDKYRIDSVYEEQGFIKKMIKSRRM